VNTLGNRTAGDDTTAPPVVLLHGLGSGARTWATFQQHLLPRRSIALDLPGHGTSPHRPAYSFESMAKEVLADLDHAVVDVVGHSLGGGVAQFMAMWAPERIRRLVIEDAAPPPHEPAELTAPPAEPPDPVDFDWAVVEPIFREIRSPHPAWWSGLPTITADTLWIAGGPVSHVDQDRLAEAVNAMPSAKVVTIQVGHHIHREAPDEFAGAVLPFLNGGSRHVT
jgi:pimeloyl-ACP methyl ester carboxylesterase